MIRKFQILLVARIPIQRIVVVGMRKASAVFTNATKKEGKRESMRKSMRTQ